MEKLNPLKKALTIGHSTTIARAVYLITGVLAGIMLGNLAISGPPGVANTAILLSSLLLLLFWVLWSREFYLQTRNCKLEEQKTIFSQLFETAPDAMITVDATGHLVMVNRQAETLFGFSRDVLHGQPVEILIPTDFKARHTGHFTKYTASPKTRYMGAGLELSALRKDGGMFPVEISLAPVNTGYGMLYAASVRDITERKLMETALKKSEKNFQILVQRVKEYAIFLLDTDGRIASWNDGAALIKGFEAAEVLGKPVDILYPPEEVDQGEPMANLYTAREKGHCEKEGWRRRRDGSRFYADIVITALYDDDHTLYGYAKITKDITYKRLVQEKLENLTRQIELTNDGIYTLNADRKIISWNRGAEIIYGYTKSEAVGRDSNELLQTDLSSIAVDQVIADLHQTGYWHSVLKRKRRDGQEIYVRTSNTIIRDDSGAIVGYVAVNIDITRQEELRLRVDHLASIVENSTEAIFSVAVDSRILSWNTGAQRLFGWNKPEAIGRPVSTLGLFLPADAVFDVAKNEISAQGHWNAELWFRELSGGTFYGAITGNCTKDPVGNLVAFTFIVKDISAVKRLEQHLRSSNEQLEKRVAERTVELYKSEKKFRSIIEHNNDLVALVDFNFRVAYLSPSCERITGWTRDVLVKRALMRFIHPEDKYMANQRYMEILGNPGKPVSLCLRFLQKEGVYVWLQGTAVNMLHDEALQTVVFSMKDVTETVVAQSKLQLNEKRFRSLIENSADAFTLFDEDLKIQYRSLSATRITGWTDDEVLRRNMMDNVHPDDRLYASSRLSDLLVQPGASTAIKFRYQHRNGHYIHVEGMATNRLEDEDICALVLNFRDVTDREEAIQQLISRERRFRAMLENNNEIIALVDQSYKLIYRSPSALKITGWEDYDIAAGLTKVIHAEDESYFKETLKKVSATNGQTARITVRSYHKTGQQLWLEMTMTNLTHNADVGGILFNVRDSTEKVQSEEALRKSEVRFRSLIEHSIEGISLFDRDMQVLYRSPSGDKMIMGGSFSAAFSRVHPDYQERFSNAFEESLGRPQEPVPYQIVFLRNNGEFFWAEGTFTNLLGIPGVEAIVANYRDITPRKTSEALLIQSEEKYRILVEQANDAIFIINERGAFLEVNESAARLAGCSKKALSEMSVYDFTLEYDLLENPLKFAELRNGRTITSERPMKTCDGRIITVEVSAQCLSDGRLLVFARDISERIRHQQEIVSERNLLKSIIDSLPSVFYMQNNADKLIRWNSNFETLLHRQGPETPVLTAGDFFDGPMQARYKDFIHKVKNEGPSDILLEIPATSPQKLTYFFSGTPVNYSGEPCIIIIGIDFTERLKIQQDLQQTSERLRLLTAHLQQVREEERKRIGREIHDELGQQLTAIKMDVAWIDKRTAISSPKKAKLVNILHLLDASNQSVRRILAELRANVLEMYGLMEALEWLGAELTGKTDIHIHFSRPAVALKATDAVENCLFRVYQEALHNIIKYSGARNVYTNLEIREKSLLFTVSDDGIGFDTEQDLVAGKFGLLGMKERAISVGGQMTLTSASGKGTMIRILIPYNEHKH